MKANTIGCLIVAKQTGAKLLLSMTMKDSLLTENVCINGYSNTDDLAGKESNVSRTEASQTL